MSTVTVHEAKTHLSRLIREVLAGGEVLIAPRGGAPVVKLVSAAGDGAKGKRKLGGLEHTLPPGITDPLADGFWDKIDEDDIAAWTGGGD